MGEGDLQFDNKGREATMPPIGWRLGPSVVLIDVINVVLQVLLRQSNFAYRRSNSALS